MRRSLLLLALLAVLVGCESDAKKLERLEGRKAVECLLQQAYWTKFDSVAYPHGPTSHQIKSPEADSLRRVWNDHRTKCELATRDYNQFMR
jgi:hypothetical protein